MYTMAPPPQQMRQWDGPQAQQQYRPAPSMSAPPPPQASAPHDHYRHAPVPQQQPQSHQPQPQTQHQQHHHHLQSGPYHLAQPAPLRTDLLDGPSRPEFKYRQQQQPPPPDFRLPPMQAAPQYFPGHQIQDFRSMQAPPPVPQSAPRQRTAIACKYCRRRKIRCSGFDNSEDGRCTNCARFNQECIFTPVSAQTQAFVPAQALYNATGRDRAAGATSPQLYGSYGQPLPRSDHHSPTSGPPSSNASTYTLPSPSSATSYTSSAQSQYPPGYPPPHTSYSHPESNPSNRRRRNEEPHTPTVPPPNPGHHAGLARRDTDSSTMSYGYHEQANYSNGISPASSTASHPPSHPQYQQAYYQGQQPPPRRPSPTSAYSYEQSRASHGHSHSSRGESSSPNGLLPHYSNGYAPHLTHQNTQHSQASSNASSMRTSTTATDRTPPTPHTPAVEHVVKPTNPMSIAGLVDPTPSRSAADKTMVSALDRPRGL